jgi:hypothetical protein
MDVNPTPAIAPNVDIKKVRETAHGGLRYNRPYHAVIAEPPKKPIFWNGA